MTYQDLVDHISVKDSSENNLYLKEISNQWGLVANQSAQSFDYTAELDADGIELTFADNSSSHGPLIGSITWTEGD